MKTPSFLLNTDLGGSLYSCIINGFRTQKEMILFTTISICFVTFDSVTVYAPPPPAAQKTILYPRKRITSQMGWDGGKGVGSAYAPLAYTGLYSHSFKSHQVRGTKKARLLRHLAQNGI